MGEVIGSESRLAPSVTACPLPSPLRKVRNASAGAEAINTITYFFYFTLFFNSSGQFNTTCISLGPVCVSVSRIRMNPLPSGVTAMSWPLSKYGPSNNFLGRPALNVGFVSIGTAITSVFCASARHG